MEQLPEQVKIGEAVYEVAYEFKLEEWSMFGRIIRNKGRIEIAPEMPPLMEEVTLWHECIHEILAQAGQQKIDERIIGALAYGLPKFIRDNPELIK